MPLDDVTKRNIDLWLNGPFDEKSKNEIRHLLNSDEEKLFLPFHKNLSFGTGGIRELMGTGSNRLNVYTVRQATQGLANYLKKNVNAPLSVIIGYDNRQNSKLFAQEAAKTLAGNDIRAYLFANLRPTPLVSFSCRKKKCSAAIMITASHNGPEYNGYKVYWSDGGQIINPHDIGIVQEIEKVQNNLSTVLSSDLSSFLIQEIALDMDKAYLDALKQIPYFKYQESGKNLQIVYSSMHGTGITIIPQALSEFGLSNLLLVEEQVKIDPFFTAAPIPNPENADALKSGIDLLLAHGADIFLATDPDADRVSLVVNHHNEPKILSGNQTACVIFDYLHKHKAHSKNKNPYFIKTIVTTELLKEIAIKNNIECIDVLTGFKFIADQIKERENSRSHFLFAAEESLGYLIEDFCRDKDSISASVLISIIALEEKSKNHTLYDALLNVYRKYGLFREKLISISYEKEKNPMEKMQSVMNKIRRNPISSLLGKSVIIYEDYLERKNLINGQDEKMSLPKSDVLRLFLEDDTKIVLRPSGTEPKLKIYLEISEKPFIQEEQAGRLDKKLDKLFDELKTYLI